MTSAADLYDLESYLRVGNLAGARSIVSRLSMYPDKLVAMKIASVCGYEQLLEEIFPVNTNENSIVAHIEFSRDHQYRASLIQGYIQHDEDIGFIAKFISDCPDVYRILAETDNRWNVFLDAFNGKVRYTNNRNIDSVIDEIHERKYGTKDNSNSWFKFI